MTNQTANAGADTIKVGIAGLGGIATRMHIPILATLENVEIVAGAEINPAQAERTQQRFGIPRIYSDCNEMLDKERLDAVYVCLPSFLHDEVARAALQKGLHVLCEKPMGLSADQAYELVCEAERRHLALVPGYQLRFSDNYRRGKELIAARRLGKILQVQGVIINPGPYAGWDPKSEWYYDPRGCGVLYDLGCHLLDLAFFLCDLEITEVYARNAISLPGLEVPDGVSVVFSTNSHILGSLNLGWSTGATFDMLQVHGTGGSLLLSSQSFEHLPPEAGGFQRLSTLWDNARHLFWRKAGRFIKASTASEGAVLSRSFVRAIADKTPVLDSAYDAVRVLEVLDAVKESLLSGKAAQVRRHVGVQP